MKKMVSSGPKYPNNLLFNFENWFAGFAARIPRDSRPVARAHRVASAPDHYVLRHYHLDLPTRYTINVATVQRTKHRRFRARVQSLQEGLHRVHSLRGALPDSEAFLVEISLRSPRKILIFIIKKIYFLDQSIRK